MRRARSAVATRVRTNSGASQTLQPKTALAVSPANSASGEFIAVLRIPPGAPVSHDTPSASEHCNLWGEPAEWAGYVESVMPVE